jgi:DNA-binding transcriptional regulator YiaG
MGAPDRRPDRPLATAIRTARQQARISQPRLARLVGVRQAAVSQWEGGRAEPSGLHMAALLRVLPELADLLDAEGTRAACGQPAETRAS